MKTSEEVLRLQRARDTLTDLTGILDKPGLHAAEALRHLQDPETRKAIATAVEILSASIREH
ncbi:MAG: hypothetical protein ACM3X6_01325 [Patescibacteria group bacterium]